MALKVFIDTNILIDFIEQRPFEIENTNRLFLLAQNHELELYTSESVITTAYYISRQAGQIEKALYLFKIICIPAGIMQTAFNSNFKDKEDAILYYGALNAKMNYFITRNEADFKKDLSKQLPVVDAKYFCAKIMGLK
jgi:predicted nucleic acid-binding protein